jgi:hypothetical protein
MASELESEPALRTHAVRVRPRMRPTTRIEAVNPGISLLGATAAAGVWRHDHSYVDSVGSVATRVSPLVLVVAVLVELAHKDRRVGWFHPLSFVRDACHLCRLSPRYGRSLAVGRGYQRTSTSTPTAEVPVTGGEALTPLVLACRVGSSRLSL